jgi:hypothetical protein
VQPQESVPTLPFNAALRSEHLNTSYPPYILWLPLSRKTFQTWTCSPAQVLIRSLLLSSSTQRKRFRMIVVRDTQKTSCFSFLLTCSICSCQTVSPHIFRTKSKVRLCTKKVQLRPPNIIACWLSMVVSIDFLQTWSGTCWRTGLLLNTKYRTHNLASAPQGTQTDPSLFCDTFSLLQKRKKWRCSLLFWTSLLPTPVFQERNFGDTCKKLRLHSIWEISFKRVHRMPTPSHWWGRKL